MAALVPAPRLPSDADLARLTAAERVELLRLLEKAAEGVPADPRPPIADLLVDCLTEPAEDADEPEVFLAATLAHHRARRRHMEALTAARGEPQGGWTIEAYLSAFNADSAEAERCAVADGFPLPAKPAPRSIPKDEL